MPGDETWGMFETVLLLAGAICLFTAAGLAVAKVRARAESLRSEVRKAYSGLYSARWVNLVASPAGPAIATPVSPANIRPR